MKNQKNSYKKFVLYLVGSFFLILGITLVLIWWQDVVVLFKAFIGMALSLTGLVILYYLNK